MKNLWAATKTQHIQKLINLKKFFLIFLKEEEIFLHVTGLIVPNLLRDNKFQVKTSWLLWYIYTMEYHSAIKKEHIWVISNEVHETGAYYTEWRKSERKTPI